MPSSSSSVLSPNIIPSTRPEDLMASLQANPFQSSCWTGERPDETEQEAQDRVLAMQEALKKSKEIEAWLLEEKKILDKRRKAIKILLLGQSESGKSSVLKNFQIAFAPKQLEKARSAWKTVVQLNIIGSLKSILDALEEEYDDLVPSAATPSAFRVLQRLRLSLSPLFFIESKLLKILAPDCTDCRGLTVQAGAAWQGVLNMKTGKQESSQEYNPTPVLIAQRNDIIALWRNAEIQEVLARRCPKLKRSSGFFLDDIERVTTPDFLPSDSDIIRARLKTIGVEEHHFRVEKGVGNVPSRDFYITDVAGIRSQRTSWIPFFDDANCILFLAPLAFNEVLEEDPSVNRVEDSYQLWKALCENKLLFNAQIILFLNKKDVLRETLSSGIMVNKYVPSFKDRLNNVETVTKYFKDRFHYYHKKYSPPSRSFLCHETSAIDIASMQMLLLGVRESILRQLLMRGELL